MASEIPQVKTTPDTTRTPALADKYVTLAILAGAVAGIWAGVAMSSLWAAAAAFIGVGAALEVLCTYITCPDDPNLKSSATVLAIFAAAVGAGTLANSVRLGVAVALVCGLLSNVSVSRVD